MKRIAKIAYHVTLWFGLLYASGITPAIIPSSVPVANKQGNSNKFQLAGANSGTLGNVLCNDASGNTTDAACSGAAVSVPFSSITSGTNVTAAMNCGAGCSILSTTTGTIVVTGIRNYTVATLPAATAGSVGYVTDGATASDCTTGLGSTKVFCIADGAAWAGVGGTPTSVPQTAIVVANNSGTGTTLNKLARFTGAPQTATVNTTSSIDGVVGVVSAGAGTTGSATIVVQGVAPCAFEGARTAGDYVIPGTGVNGDCKDSATNVPYPAPTGGVQALGVSMSTSGFAGTGDVYFFGGSVTTKFRSGLWLSSGNSALTPCNNDLIQGLAANTSIWTWGTTGILIQPPGTACANSAGPLDVEGGTPGNNQTVQAPIKLIGPGGANGSNSGITGGTGGPITITGGQGGGFTGGSGSTGGTGGGVVITAGKGGTANSGSTNGPGGDVTMASGTAGAGAGTASIPGNVIAKIGASEAWRIDNVGHMSTSGTAPTFTSCGTTPAITGDDNTGTITVGTGVVTACTIAFNATWNAAPACVLSTSSAAIGSSVSAVSVTAVTFTFAADLSAGTVYYQCRSHR